MHDIQDVVPDCVPAYIGHDEPSLILGDGYSDSLAERLWARCTDAQREFVVEYFAGTFGEPELLSYGTMCSGTECPTQCIRSLEKVIHRAARAAGFPASRLRPMEARFGCELNVGKRAFIKKLFGPEMKHLYTNMCELSRLEVDCYICGIKVEVLAAALVLAGFPCIQASRLNPNQDRCAVSALTGSTGLCFAAIVEYAVKHGVAQFISRAMLFLVYYGNGFPNIFRYVVFRCWCLGRRAWTC